jgi:hypothetical protein
MNPVSHHPEEKLLDYAYGELSAAESKTVEAHIRSCPQCADSLSSMKRVRQTMSQLPIVPAPSRGLDSLKAYAEQAAQRARGRAKRSRSWMTWLVPVTGVAALSVVLVISTRVMKMGYSTAPSESSSRGTLEVPRPPPATPSDQSSLPRGMAASEPSPGEMANQAKTAFAKRPEVNSEPLLKHTVSVPPAKAGEEKASTQGLAEPPPAAAPRYEVSERRVGGEESNARDRKEPAEKWASAPPKAEHGKDIRRARDRESAQGIVGGVVGGTLGGAVRTEAPGDKQQVAKGIEEGVVDGVPGGVVAGIAKHDATGDRQRIAEGRVAGDGTANEDALSEKQRAQNQLASREADTAIVEGHATVLSHKSARSQEYPASSYSLSLQAAEARRGGDREREVGLLRQALRNGAQGQDRARLLAQLCDALDALKRQAEADSACGDLIREFPNSDEAKAAVARQALRSKAKD